MAKTPRNERSPSPSSETETPGQWKKQAQLLAKAQLAVDRAQRGVQRAERKLARAQKRLLLKEAIEFVKPLANWPFV